MEGNQMRVMRVIAGNFSTNVNKVSKEKVINKYTDRNHPAITRITRSSEPVPGPPRAFPVRVIRTAQTLVSVASKHCERAVHLHESTFIQGFCGGKHG